MGMEKGNRARSEMIGFKLTFMKSLLIKLLCLLGLVGCTSNAEKGIFLYNTLEYNELVKTSKISLNDAEKIICNAINDGILLYSDNKNITDTYFPLSKNISLRHYLIYLDDYVFIYKVPTHAGTIEISSGIFVNRNTGELIQKPYKKNTDRIVIHNVRDSYLLKCNKK